MRNLIEQNIETEQDRIGFRHVLVLVQFDELELSLQSGSIMPLVDDQNNLLDAHLQSEKVNQEINRILSQAIFKMLLFQFRHIECDRPKDRVMRQVEAKLEPIPKLPTLCSEVKIAIEKASRHVDCISEMVEVDGRVMMSNEGERSVGRCDA